MNVLLHTSVALFSAQVKLTTKDEDVRSDGNKVTDCVRNLKSLSFSYSNYLKESLRTVTN
jgi:hypothetical protein